MRMPNNRSGVLISFASFNHIGTVTSGATTTGAGNIISGNLAEGIRIQVLGATGNEVQGNFIGTDVTGTSPIPNGSHGVALTLGASNNTIGARLGNGQPAGRGNTIAFNGGAGVFIDTGTRNAILSNSIFFNNGLGIDLQPLGPTPNDALDGDTGANMLQNFPLLSKATLSGATLTVTGILPSKPNSRFLIQFFANDPTAFVEGRTFIGSLIVMTNASGNASFTATGLLLTPGQSFVSSTATDLTLDANGIPAGNTSEFSHSVAGP
jgi:hypothetical protein